MQPACPALDLDTVRNSFLFYKTVTGQYRDQNLLRSIKSIIPDAALGGGQLPALLQWFKNFMTWTPNQIACENCSRENNPSLMQVSVEQGDSWQVRKTEIHSCKKCGARKVIPRYSDALQIARTRYGRCGEWSILFGAVLSSVSVESRIAYDYLDHCWNEVFLDGRWVHVDSTFPYPSSLDNPHYYERNWNKQYSYVIAFSPDRIEDVTERYTEKLDEVLARRKGLDLGEISTGSMDGLQELYKNTQSLYRP